MPWMVGSISMSFTKTGRSGLKKGRLPCRDHEDNQRG